MYLIQVFITLVYLFWVRLITKGNKVFSFIAILFVALYGLQLVLAIIDPYNYAKPISPYSVVFFNLQLLFFVVGISCATKHFKMVLPKERIEKIFELKISSPILVIQTITLFIAFWRFKKMSAFVATLALQTNLAREYYFTELYSSYTQLFVMSFFDAFKYISYFFMFGLLLFTQRKKTIIDWYMILSTVVIVVLTTISSQGRFVIMQFAVIFLLYFIVGKHYYPEIYKKKIIPFSALALVLFTLVIVITTLARNNLVGLATSSDFISQIDKLIIEPFSTYFYVPILAFDYGKDYIFNDIVPMFGGATFAGIVDFLLTPFVYIDNSIQGINNILGNRMTPEFDFPVTGCEWNALFTGASNYYIDFGLFGAVLFPFLHGVILAYFFSKVRLHPKYFIALIFIFWASYKHVASSGIQSIEIVFLFFWVIICSKKKWI